MSLKNTVLRQYRLIVERAAKQCGEIKTPPEGWIRTMREALGMSGTDLAQRVGVTRARVSQAEQAELSGGVTLKAMNKFADSVGCKFVYAIVPRTSIDEIMRIQAHKKARAVVSRASKHMALENQALSKKQLEEELDRLTDDLVRSMPSDFWSDK